MVHCPGTLKLCTAFLFMENKTISKYHIFIWNHKYYHSFFVFFLPDKSYLFFPQSRWNMSRYFRYSSFISYVVCICMLKVNRYLFYVMTIDTIHQDLIKKQTDETYLCCNMKMYFVIHLLFLQWCPVSVTEHWNIIESPGNYFLFIYRETLYRLFNDIINIVFQKSEHWHWYKYGSSTIPHPRSSIQVSAPPLTALIIFILIVFYLCLQ